MRRELSQRVRKTFTAEMARCCPQFAPVKRTKGLPEGPFFLWRHPSGLNLGVLLQTSDAHDKFLVELSWSDRRVWPGSVMPDEPSQPPQHGEQRFRLSRLWDSRKGMAGARGEWWSVDGPSAPVSAEAAAADAVARVVEHGLPYFERIVREHGRAI